MVTREGGREADRQTDTEETKRRRQGGGERPHETRRQRQRYTDEETWGAAETEERRDSQSKNAADTLTGRWEASPDPSLAQCPVAWGIWGERD